ncbi:GIY-YIG nuclease family protein [bacterium]|jgi:DNA polymerase III subunit epsilon|nr:GIY-YIG nuclease family protein [bacterium]MBT6293987.1 GIY-YIG nuclease family protein [bacterium]
MNFNEKRFAFVDIETTGPNSKKDKVIDVSVKIVENNQLISSYESLVNPKRYIPSFIQNFTGIKPEMVKDKPVFKDIAEDLFDILDGCIFVAHNVRFDYNFLKAEFERVGISFNASKLCTVKLSRNLFPEHKRHNLDSVIERCNLKIDIRHRAEADCLALVQFWDYLHVNFKTDYLFNAIAQQLDFIRTPLNVEKAMIENLPQGCGVYVMSSSKDGFPLYIGKSKNIKERVMQHFTGGLKSKKDMQILKQVEDISAIETQGEFSALMLEASMIREHKPLLNKRLRDYKQLYQAELSKCENGIYSVSIKDFDFIDPDKSYLGLFRTKKDFNKLLLRLAKDFDLCHKLLGIEKAKDSCFNYNLEKCKGACVGKEKIKEHNKRLLKAFKKYEIQKWPFDGMVLLKEGNISHLIHNWCYLKKVENQSDLDDSLNTSFEYNFNYDDYLIMKKFLNGNYNYEVLSNANSFE